MILTGMTMSVVPLIWMPFQSMTTVMFGKAVFLGEPARLGHLPLCLLAVAHEHVDVEVLMPDPAGEGEAAAGREPLPEVPRRPVYEGDAPDHVSLERAPRLSEKRHHLVHGQMAEAREARVDAGRRVAVAHHDPVARAARQDPRTRRRRDTSPGTTAIPRDGPTRRPSSW